MSAQYKVGTYGQMIRIQHSEPVVKVYESEVSQHRKICMNADPNEFSARACGADAAEGAAEVIAINLYCSICEKILHALEWLCQ